jgi:hypothetical protein
MGTDVDRETALNKTFAKKKKNNKIKETTNLNGKP